MTRSLLAVLLVPALSACACASRACPPCGFETAPTVTSGRSGGPPGPVAPSSARACAGGADRPDALPPPMARAPAGWYRWNPRPDASLTDYGMVYTAEERNWLSAQGAVVALASPESARVLDQVILVRRQTPGLVEANGRDPMRQDAVLYYCGNHSVRHVAGSLGAAIRLSKEFGCIWDSGVVQK